MPIDLGLGDDVIEVVAPVLPIIDAAPPQAATVDVVAVAGPPGPMTESDVQTLIQDAIAALPDPADLIDDVTPAVDHVYSSSKTDGQITALTADVGDVSALDTADTSSLVAALNEVAANVADVPGIDDGATTTSSTWSSSKISSQIAADAAALIDDALDAHIADPEPHPPYDDIQSLTLLFENRLV